MRTFVLTALLLAPVALAQTMTQTIPALPSAPAAPTTPAPAVAVPATSAPVLLLTAPVGSGVELVMTQTTQMKVKDVQVTAAPGSKLSEAQLNDIRRGLADSVAKGMPAQSVPGKLFVKVTGRDANGQTTLLTTLVQNVAGVGPMTLRATQLVGPDGKVTFRSMESDNPQVAGVLKAMTPEKMQSYATQNGTDIASVYGKPLLVGETRTATSTLDAQGLFQSLFAVAGPDTFAKVAASPLNVTTAVTYKGQNAQKQLTFETLTQLGAWQLDTTTKMGAGAAESMKMNIALQGATGKSTAAYRPDGLPVSQNTSMNMDMRMTMQMQGVQVRMTMNINQTITLRPR